MQRRHRLSRSRDFDTVYRRGSSVSSRHLTLHTFPREDDPEGEPRLDLAVPRAIGSAVTRNRIKRLLREIWRSRLDAIPRGRDYVLVARPALAGPAETRDLEWLDGEVDDLLGKMSS